MRKVAVPVELDSVLKDAWEAARVVPGFLTEPEARFLGMAAALTPAAGDVIEIGSFKGKSSVMMARVCRAYGLARIVAVDPHNFNNPQFAEFRTSPEATTFDDFTRSLRDAGVADFVTPRREYSSEVARTWDRPLRLLWIDGDHSYAGARADFDGFIRFVEPGGIVAFHDALHEDPGPIAVFVEEVLRSDKFGPAGFVGSIAWAQFRPADGAQFREQRLGLERRAARLLPFVASGKKLKGASKLRFKLTRSRVPRALPTAADWADQLNRFL